LWRIYDLLGNLYLDWLDVLDFLPVNITTPSPNSAKRKLNGPRLFSYHGPVECAFSVVNDRFTEVFCELKQSWVSLNKLPKAVTSCP
jgi:hypothetical protein